MPNLAFWKRRRDDKEEKSLEKIHPDNLPKAEKDNVAVALTTVVERSSTHHDVSESLHMHLANIGKNPWFEKLIPGLEDLASKHHIGNYVVIRSTNEEFFESMPIYARIGMHLLFYGKEEIKLLQNHTVEHILQEQSVKEGKIFDSPESVKSIPSFVKTYSLNTEELENPNLDSYKCFNEFFYRKLKAGARPVQNADDPTGFCSAADCRLTVFRTVDLAKQLWIKGNNFSVPNLLGVSPNDSKAAALDGGSVAVFRLAPADYHRFHCPLDGVVGDIHHMPGQYYTVNPQAVNEPGFDVFTANTRSVLYLTHTKSGSQVAFVAIGALLVGSIKWTAGSEKGKTVKRGDELGYFAYGGSTIVVIFPKGVISFDEDLVTNSEKPVETLMQVGYSLGRAPSKDATPEKPQEDNKDKGLKDKLKGKDCTVC